MLSYSELKQCIGDTFCDSHWILCIYLQEVIHSSRILAKSEKHVLNKTQSKITRHKDQGMTKDFCLDLPGSVQGAEFIKK